MSLQSMHNEMRGAHSMSGRMCQGGMPKAAGCISAAAARVLSFRKQKDVSVSAVGRQSSAHRSR